MFVCRYLPLSYVLTNWFKRDKLVKVITQCHLVAMLLITWKPKIAIQCLGIKPKAINNDSYIKDTEHKARTRRKRPTESQKLNFIYHKYISVVSQSRTKVTSGAMQCSQKYPFQLFNFIFYVKLNR